MIGGDQPLGAAFNPFDPEVQAQLNEIAEAASRFKELEEDLQRVVVQTWPKGGGGGGADNGIYRAVVTAVNFVEGQFNATYDVRTQQLDAEGNPLISLYAQTPINRMFDSDLVDFEPAAVDDYCVISRHLDDPSLPEGFGACVKDDGTCELTDGPTCSEEVDGVPVNPNAIFLLGVRCPGYVVHITEKVKISVCPDTPFDGLTGAL